MGSTSIVSSSTLAAVLMWLLVLVVGSGVLGLVVPEHRAEAHARAGAGRDDLWADRHVLEQYRAEAGRLVEMTCGRSRAVAKGESEQAVVAGAAQRAQSYAPVGSPRQVGRAR